ncbi:FG-GAP-like repeat-containing protein [Tunturiibacter psychrotolerans]|uniref:FG-GAP-like repeat-containing protein n=1 Tax=Tunturiibacter psychrotolerans TaxID=3069686 RepID=UPI003D1A872A
MKTMHQTCPRHLRSLVVLLAISAQALAATVATTTTTDLAVSPGNHISEGTIVTFVATVMNTAPVTQGTVYFCRSLNPTCLIGEGMYGSSHLTSSGTATLRTRLNVGDDDVVAIFKATRANLGSASAAVTLSVSAQVVYPSSTSLTVSGVPGSYTLTGSVSSYGIEPMYSTVDLLNTTAGNTEISAAMLSNPTISLSGAVSYSVGHQPNGVVTGDFNGDGIPDLVVANQNDNTISVLLGNGDGTFRQQTIWATAHTPEAITVGDFNGDGSADLAVADTNANCVSIFLGNGDGSFQSQVVYSVGLGPESIATGDFNNDGIADLVVANASDVDVTVLLGNGDGTFQGGSTYPTGRSPQSVVVGDFNSDGVVDLAVANADDGTVSILFGHGDGTFAPQTTLATEVDPVSIATADLNNDGIVDLVVANRISNTVSILIGNGLGGFQNQVPVTTGAAPDAVAVGDFNGDGNPDLAVCNQFDSSISVLLGNGDGTFLPRQSYSTKFSNGLSLVVGDFNGDGLTDLANTDAAELNVQLGQQIAGFTVTGIAGLEPGTNLILADYLGDNIRFPSQSLTVPLVEVSPTATVSLFSAPNPASFGTVVTLSATVVGGGGIAPTGQVIFKDGTTVLGTSGISGGTATITARGLTVGVHYITAVYVGDSNYAMTTSTPLVQTISKATAVINLTSSINPSVFGYTVTITAQITKGATGTVLFMDGENTIGSVIVNGDGGAAISTANLAAGFHTITAIYSGDQNFE